MAKSSARRLSGLVGFFLISLFAWIALSFPPTYPDIAAGTAASALVAWLSRALPRANIMKLASPVRWARLAAFCAVFAASEIRSVASVAGCVFTGRISPSMVRIPISSHTDFGRLLIANGITLTPGTLTVKDDGYLHVHCLRQPGRGIVAHALDKSAAKVTE